MCPQLDQAGVRRHLTRQPTGPPFTVNTYVCLAQGADDGAGAGLVTPGLTSDCPLQLDTVRSLIFQSSLRTLV